MLDTIIFVFDILFLLLYVKNNTNNVFYEGCIFLH